MIFINIFIGVIAPISPYSYATTSFYIDKCGPKYGKCDPGYCCNQYGWCGKTEEHCSINKGCQPNFGNCIGIIPTKPIITKKTIYNNELTEFIVKINKLQNFDRRNEFIN
ncbi:carbohydrate-binding module family 18 protein [Piromyces sp. E2]|nr:carbohydrate-binding module family 18 protein [Piromyces sp. E2]|eukprot:OUM57970.1 carbohydrate-binding module family 18 protein [Piromyces sp. E2]